MSDRNMTIALPVAYPVTLNTIDGGRYICNDQKEFEEATAFLQADAAHMTIDTIAESIHSAIEIPCGLMNGAIEDPADQVVG
jgi:hypothetical protein